MVPKRNGSEGKIQSSLLVAKCGYVQRQRDNNIVSPRRQLYGDLLQLDHVTGASQFSQ